MDIQALGFTEKWIAYGFLEEKNLTKSADKYGDQYEISEERFAILMDWLDNQKEISTKQTECFIEIALEDEDKILGGKSLAALLERVDISSTQFDLVKHNLWRFGSWTKKVITKEELRRRLENEELSQELLDLCMDYKNTYKDNRLSVMIIKKSQDEHILKSFLTNGSGKQIRTLAEKKLKRISK